MIRQPPTAIILGRSDLREFDRRRQRRREAEYFNQRYSHYIAPAHPLFDPRQIQSTPQECYFEADGQRLLTGDGEQDESTADQTNELQGFTPDLAHGEFNVSGSAAVEEEHLTGADFQDEYASVHVDAENPAQDSQRSPSPAKDDFYYGGFLETPSERFTDNTPNRTPPFVPDDISTPQSIHPPDTNRLRTRLPLPRSPLYLSQNASISPDHRPTTGLTPHVASRVATHNTPGVIFSQPARRMRRPPQGQRAFRHQTNSFSFDSSERSSAAYEQERVSSTSTNGSTLRPFEDLSLHEELRGSSLQSSRVTSGVSYAVPDPLAEEFSTVRITDESDRMEFAENERNLSSPQLPLPPPFSTVSRSASGVETFPGAQYMAPNPRTSPIRSISLATPGRSAGEVSNLSPNLNNNSSPMILESVGEVGSSPPVVNGISPRSLMRRAADSVVDFYRTRSPVRRGSPTHPSPSPSPTPRRGQTGNITTDVPSTPSRSYRVYNDSLPSSSQPQTPANLPEARHQSRFHPAHTAPVTRGAVRRGDQRMYRVDGGTREGPSMQRIQQLYTPLRRGVGRSNSPTGMMQGGFAGLYGGAENADEENNWAEGVRFSYAETRLWGLRDARNDGTSLRETPEPEDWRVGRRRD